MLRPNALKSLNKSIKKLCNDSLTKDKTNLSKRKVLEYKSPMVPDYSAGHKHNYYLGTGCNNDD